jgi:single-strand DNA-binding protein
MNRVTLLGNVGQDPDIRSTATGKRVANFTLATSKSWKPQGSTEWKEETQWHRLVAWGPLAEAAEKYVTKGKRVLVEGEIQYRTWQDREGQTRYTTEINVRELFVFASGTPQEKPQEKPQGFDDFPAALDGEEDDLPF